MNVSIGLIVADLIVHALSIALIVFLAVRKFEPMDTPDLNRRIRGAGETP